MVKAYSVVIPVFNGEATIVEAIASVTAQTIPPQQVIVVDDGSTDNTLAIVSALAGPIKIVQQSNQGPGAATSVGFSLCDTELVATLDADDIWLPKKISKQLTAMNCQPDLAAVFCRLANFYADPNTADFAGARGGWSRSTMLIKRNVIADIGPIIDPPGRAGEMVDWFARGLELGHLMHVMDEPLALRRIHSGSLTYNHQDLGKSYLQVAHAALIRRRLAKARKAGNVD